VTKMANRSIVVLLALSLLLGCTTGCQGSDGTSPTANNRLQVGISYGSALPSMSDDGLANALDDAVTIGATWIRLDLSWAAVQPTSPQTYVWARFDRIFAEARRRHLNVLPVLVDTPGWARLAGCAGNHCAPADPSQFATFASAAAARFAPTGIHTWEIWNEPNSALFWQPEVDPTAYANLVQSASQAIRKADSKAFLLIGGLTVGKTANGTLSVADFLAQAPQSPLRFVDALAVHTYTWPYPASRLGPWMSPWAQADSGLPYLRQLLAQSGTPNLPIWVTEYGAPTGGPGRVWDGSPDSLSRSPDHVTELQQAIIASDSVATAASDPIIRTLFWYTDRDSTAQQDTEQGFYGLRRADGSKKAAFDALTDAVKRLGS
jgi:polysaccharide biosynthesis protein PslG